LQPGSLDTKVAGTEGFMGCIPRLKEGGTGRYGLEGAGEMEKNGREDLKANRKGKRMEKIWNKWGKEKRVERGEKKRRG